MIKRNILPKQQLNHQELNHLTFLAVLLILLLQLYGNFANAQCNEQGCHDVDLKIMSWNIYMLPHYCVQTGQSNMTKEIVEVLNK